MAAPSKWRRMNRIGKFVLVKRKKVMGIPVLPTGYDGRPCCAERGG
jgi:hypothetical protein